MRKQIRGDSRSNSFTKTAEKIFVKFFFSQKALEMFLDGTSQRVPTDKPTDKITE
jgi:hypothetical protein